MPIPEISAWTGNIYLWDKIVAQGECFKIPRHWLIWYRPLQSDLLDISWNWNDWTWQNWSWTFNTAWSYKWARITITNNSWYSFANNYIKTNIIKNTYPLSFWCRVYRYSEWDNRCIMWNWSNWWSSHYWIDWWNSEIQPFYWSYYFRSSQAMDLNTRFCLLITIKNWETKLYVNWQLKDTTAYWWNASWWTYRTIWSWSYASFQSKITWMDWLIKDAVLYNRILDENEALKYYNWTL